MIGLLVGVMVGALVAGSAGYVLGKRSVATNPVQPTASPAATPIVAASPEVPSESGKAEMRTYTSPMYSYQIGYPSNFELNQNSIVRDETSEQLVFNNQNPVAGIKSFSVRVAPGTADGYYLDAEATDTTKIGETIFNYFSLPEGYADGAPNDGESLPIIAFETEKEGLVYEISFYGTSELSEPFVQMVMESFAFTR